MTPGGPVVASVATDVILMRYPVMGERIVQCLTTQVEEALRLLGPLSHEEIIDLIVCLRILQEMLQRDLRIGVAGAEDAEIGKQVE